VVDSSSKPMQLSPGLENSWPGKGGAGNDGLNPRVKHVRFPGHVLIKPCICSRKKNKHMLENGLRDCHAVKVNFVPFCSRCLVIRCNHVM
jgi:hypothetical protein